MAGLQYDNETNSMKIYYSSNNITNRKWYNNVCICHLNIKYVFF